VHNDGAPEAKGKSQLRESFAICRDGPSHKGFDKGIHATAAKPL